MAIFQESILEHITETTTSDQISELLENLERFKDECIADIQRFEPFHFPAGRHFCIAETYQEVAARLTNLRILTPEPEPPLPREPLQTPAQVLDNLEEFIRHDPDATTIGSDVPWAGEEDTHESAPER